MANSAQARKRARQAVKQRAHNASLRSTLRTCHQPAKGSSCHLCHNAASPIAQACNPTPRRPGRWP